MKKHSIEYLLKTLIVWTISTIFMSCSGMYDSLREFAMEETIYPASFDTIAGKIGFERVEIDLYTKGRIPASQMSLTKAKKTIVECSLFEKPLVIDSVCSWVNITGLTQPEEYTFKIYTEDEYGNRSIPKEISLIPYTSFDLEQIVLLSPKITESSSTALMEWENKLSGVLFDCYGYSYEYSDRNGILHTGTGKGDIPSFFIENITKGSTIPVEVTLQITPKKNNSLIIDTINWTSVIPLTISESAGDVIFLKTPAPAHTIDLNDTQGTQSYSFSWTKVENIDSYTLKISTSSSFPADKTFEKNVGNVSEVDVSIQELAKVLANGSARCYWTIAPSSTNQEVNTQIRPLTIFRKIIPSGLWLFNDPTDLFKASIGESLIEVSLGGDKITIADGPSVHDRAIFVPKLSYLTCKHGIIPKLGNNYVNKYTVLMNLKLTSFRWFSIADINSANNNGEWFISPNGELSLNGWWNSANTYMKVNTWHQVIYSVNLDESVKIFLDNNLSKTIKEGANWNNPDYYGLRPELYLFKDDNSWNDINDVYVSEIIIWDIPLNEMEVEQLDKLKYR